MQPDLIHASSLPESDFLVYLLFHQNKAKALKVLCAKLYELERTRLDANRSKLRTEQVMVVFKLKPINLKHCPIDRRSLCIF